MKRAISYAAVAMLSIFSIAACDNAAKIPAAPPASGAQLHEFSRKWNDKVDLTRDAALLQRLCVNASGAPCAPDTATQLKKYGLTDESVTVDLAYAFVSMAADAKDGTIDQKASDENFVASCYRVMFGREADAEGAAHHLATISGKGEDVRKAVAASFLRSPEFNSQS